MKFGTHVLCMISQRFFLFYQKFLSVDPLGCESLPKVPHLEIPSDCLEKWYICSVPRYLTNVFFFHFSEIPPFPHSTPGGDFPPQKNSKISKLSPIVLKLGMYVLWNITSGRVLSVFRNSLRSPPPACCLPECPVSRRGLMKCIRI